MAGIRVLAPVEVLARVDEFELVLLSVEILDETTGLNLYCPRTDRTSDLIEQYERELAAVSERYRNGDRSTRPPEWPVEKLFGHELTIDDGRGTTFDQHAGQYGGTGTEWLVRHQFRGTPAPEAEALTVSITPPGQPTSRLRVPLPSV